MFRVPDKPFGLGNLFIFISQLDDKTPVSDTIKDCFRSKYIEFKNLNIVKDDDTPSIEVPPIYINPITKKDVHPNIRNKISPTPLMTDLIEENIHLINDCTVGLAIRTGNHNFKNTTDVKFDSEVELYNHVHVTTEGLYRFENIIRNTPGNVFVACDNLCYKHHLTDMFGPRVKYVDRESIMVAPGNTVDEYSPFLEFFLLSKCKHLYLTGGKKDDSLQGFSTFGYMAAIYGNCSFTVVFN
jgi:hypothetical protein